MVLLVIGIEKSKWTCGYATTLISNAYRPRPLMTGEPTERGLGGNPKKIMREKEFKITIHGVRHSTVDSLDKAVEICNKYRGYGMYSDMSCYHYGVARATLVSETPEVIASLLRLKSVVCIDIRYNFELTFDNWLTIIEECEQRMVTLLFNGETFQECK